MRHEANHSTELPFGSAPGPREYIVVKTQLTCEQDEMPYKIDVLAYVPSITPVVSFDKPHNRKIELAPHLLPVL